MNLIIDFSLKIRKYSVCVCVKQYQLGALFSLEAISCHVNTVTYVMIKSLTDLC